jgi:hypothetical protein
MMQRDTTSSTMLKPAIGLRRVPERFALFTKVVSSFAGKDPIPNPASVVT